MYTNCDTLTNKLSELTIAIELNNPDIIVLTEVTPKNNRYTLQKSEIEIKGFNLFTTNFRLAPICQQSGTLLFCSCHGIAGFLVDELEI